MLVVGGATLGLRFARKSFVSGVSVLAFEAVADSLPDAPLPLSGSSLPLLDGGLSSLRRSGVGSLSLVSATGYTPGPVGLTLVPIGEDLISPPVLISCFLGMAGGRSGSVVAGADFCAFALFSSTIHAGWFVAGVACFGLGDSGLLRAASSQLEDLVGLHLRGSIVLDGLDGGVFSSSGSGSAALGVGVVCPSASFSWLDVGLCEDDDSSRSMLGGRVTLFGAVRCEKSIVFLATEESARCNPPGEVTLHRLTLSERFIMALCTKPPMPLVGETGLVGDERPVGWRCRAGISPSSFGSVAGGSRREADVRGSGGPSFSAEDGDSDRGVAASLVGSAEESRDMPGS